MNKLRGSSSWNFVSISLRLTVIVSVQLAACLLLQLLLLLLLLIVIIVKCSCRENCRAEHLNAFSLHLITFHFIAIVRCLMNLLLFFLLLMLLLLYEYTSEWIEVLVCIDANVFACKMFLIENNKVSLATSTSHLWLLDTPPSALPPAPDTSPSSLQTVCDTMHKVFHRNMKCPKQMSNSEGKRRILYTLSKCWIEFGMNNVA